jgi:hypothetical protein
MREGMDDNESSDIKKSSINPTLRLPRSYNFLIRLSKKLGVVATKYSIVHDLKSFLNHEISISPSERLFRNTAPKSVPTRPSRDSLLHTKTSNGSQIEVAEKEKSLKKIVSQSHEVLMSANTVFPITLFPDSVTLDRTKVTITRRDFFWSSDVLSIRIEDVLNVQASVGPLFGSLTLVSRVMSTVDHFKISHLWRHDTIRLKHIIQGYVIAQHNKIDTSHLSKKDLVDTLIELGHDSN